MSVVCDSRVQQPPSQDTTFPYTGLQSFGGALTSVDRGEPRTTALPISKRLDPGVRRSEPLRHAAGYCYYIIAILRDTLKD